MRCGRPFQTKPAKNIVAEFERPDHRDEKLQNSHAVLPARGRLECAVRNCWEQWTTRMNPHAKSGLELTLRKTTRERIEGSCGSTSGTSNSGLVSTISE
ncbi:hypothetical protein TNCV_3898081 [Trichonephila clavipes]|nr:hypothetical protein TNCV_3898081 [Trichonephila clavipes]